MKKYRVVVHPDGTCSTRGTERDRVYVWAVVRELPEGAAFEQNNETYPLPRFEVISWRSDLTSAERHADKMNKTRNEYLGNPAVYTVVSTAPVADDERVESVIFRLQAEVMGA